jgi:hypothetical protein
MTIAAGFICSDGVLLASDTLYSGYQRQYGRKFWTLGKGTSLLILGGAGTELCLKRIKEHVEDGLAKKEVAPLRAIGVIEKAIKTTHALMKPAPHERTELLIALRINGKARLYHNPSGESGVIPVDQEVSHCVGAAYGLGLYFARYLFSEGMPMRWAQVIAAHLIRNAKEYSNGYCGGETHMFELPDSGPPNWIRDQAQIRDLEAHLGSIEEGLRLVLPNPTQVSEYTLQERFNQLRQAIDRLRLAQFIAVPHLVATSIVGDWISAALKPGAGVTPSASEAAVPEAQRDPEDPKGER